MSSTQQRDLASHQPAWTELERLARASHGQPRMAAPLRTRRWRRSAAGLTVDLARHFIDDDILNGLCRLAEQQGLPALVDDLFAGLPVNNTEQRPALHPLLRQAAPPAEIAASLAIMERLAARLRAGQWRGFSDRPITDIVNIGIGGSDLGPRMVIAALRPLADERLRVHFVANVDPADFTSTVADLDPATTLFLIASKSFTTQETQVNAAAARRWLRAAGAVDDGLKRHFIAITAQPERARQDDIPGDQILPFAEGVGGRYSLWSSIGFSIACAIGMENFQALLAGARAMDDHFRDTPLFDNVPFLLGALDVWYTGCIGTSSVAVLPYAHDLALLPAYLQQLTMESNGKRVTRSGSVVNYPTCPVFWGEAGTRGQHSFHQLLHQGTALIPCDFILPLTSREDAAQHRLVVANCLAQAQILASGLDATAVRAELIDGGATAAQASALAPHKVMPGSRPSTLISFPALTPETLGALLALYEHRVFASAALWGINPFDQWGVELGKKISDRIAPLLAGNGGNDSTVADALTTQLVADYQQAIRQDAP